MEELYYELLDAIDSLEDYYLQLNNFSEDIDPTVRPMDVANALAVIRIKFSQKVKEV